MILLRTVKNNVPGMILLQKKWGVPPLLAAKVYQQDELSPVNKVEPEPRDMTREVKMQTDPHQTDDSLTVCRKSGIFRRT